VNKNDIRLFTCNNLYFHHDKRIIPVSHSHHILFVGKGRREALGTSLVINVYNKMVILLEPFSVQTLRQVMANVKVR